MTLVLSVIAVACFWIPLLRLTQASLWSDELATVHIAAPDLSFFDAYWDRMLRDVNPPLYYVLQHFWLQMFSDFTLGSRLLSTLFAVAAVLLLVFGAGKGLSLPARAFLAAAPVTGFSYIYFAAEARAYSLSILIGVGQAILFGRLLDKIKGGSPPTTKDFVALALLSFLNGMTHYYGAFYSGALLAVLCVYALALGRPDYLWRLVATGLTGPGANVIYAVVALRYTNLSSDAAWIPSDWAFLERNLREFAWLGAGGHHGGALLFVVLAVMACVALVGGDVELRTRFIETSLPYLLVVITVVLLSVAVSKLVHPSTVYRYLLICMPAIWVGSARCLDLGLRKGRPLMRPAALSAMVVACLWGAPFAALSGGGNREEWRGSARFVSQIEACRNSEVPVYAGPGFNSVPLFSMYLDPAKRQAPVHSSQFAGGGPCPILLWAVHGLEDQPVEDAETSGGRVVQFEHTRFWDCWPTSCNLMNRTRDVGAIVVLRKEM